MIFAAVIIPVLLPFIYFHKVQLHVMEWDQFMLRLVLGVFGLVLGYQPLDGQTAIRLGDCNIPYVDPQEAGDDNGQNRDTLFYENYFNEPNQVRSFYIDINAFGGQQTDRTKVFAILPDSSLKLMGSLEFGNCVNCVEGFALMDQQELLISAVSDENGMNMWLESLGNQLISCRVTCKPWPGSVGSAGYYQPVQSASMWSIVSTVIPIMPVRNSLLTFIARQSLAIVRPN